MNDDISDIRARMADAEEGDAIVYPSDVARLLAIIDATPDPSTATGLLWQDDCLCWHKCPEPPTTPDRADRLTDDEESTVIQTRRNIHDGNPIDAESLLDIIERLAAIDATPDRADLDLTALTDALTAEGITIAPSSLISIEAAYNRAIATPNRADTKHAATCDLYRIAESWEPYGVPRRCTCGALDATPDRADRDTKSAAQAAYFLLNMGRCSDCGLAWPEGYIHPGCPTKP